MSPGVHPRQLQAERDCPLPGLGQPSCPSSGGGTCVSHTHTHTHTHTRTHTDAHAHAPGGDSQSRLTGAAAVGVGAPAVHLALSANPSFPSSSFSRPRQPQPRALLSCRAGVSGLGDSSSPGEEGRAAGLEPDRGPSVLGLPLAPCSAPQWLFSGSGGLLADLCGQVCPCSWKKTTQMPPYVVTQGSRAVWGEGTEHRKRQSPCGNACVILHHCDIFTVFYKVLAATGRGKRVLAGGLRSNGLKVPMLRRKLQTSGCHSRQGRWHHSVGAGGS